MPAAAARRRSRAGGPSTVACADSAATVSDGAASSLAAWSMSARYLSRMWSVSLACSASTDSMPSSTSVRAQSSVSDTDGAFFSSSWRIERTMRATWSARRLADARHLGQHDRPLALEVGVVDVQEQAAALERLGQLTGVVGGQEDQRDLLGPHRAELGDRHLVVGQDLEQQRLGLDLDPVDLVDQQHHRLVGPDGLEQRAGEQELVGEDVVLELVPATRRCARPGCAAAASCSSTRRGPWTRRGPRSTAGGSDGRR